VATLQPNLRKLIPVGEDARQAVLEVTREEVLDRAKTISKEIEQRVKQLTDQYEAPPSANPE
jgi:4-aminobutyrate aminotransferase-like enzyme